MIIVIPWEANVKKAFLRTAAILACILMAVAGAHASESVVWQIGQFDNNYAEFAIAGDNAAYRRAFPKGVGLRVGQDDPAKTWPFIQPGPDDAGWAGRGAHSHDIVFQLPNQPKGLFTLTIDFISAHAVGAPTFEVSVNGRRGSFVVPAGPGDGPLTDPSQGREYISSLPISASLLRQGENTIGLRITQGSWAIYDALRLANDPDASLLPMAVESVSITPTSRVVLKDGKQKRIVQISAKLSRGMTAATVAIKTDSGTEHVALASDIAGTAQAEALIDEISKPTRMEATVTSEGASKTVVWDMQPQRQWNLYVLPASHVDIGYTDWQERVAQVHSDNVTHALDLCARYPDFKWNTEAAWVEDNYLSMMPEKRRAEFIRRAKEGRIGCSAIYASMLTGICSHEALIRDLYYAHGAARQYGIPFDMAVSCDVPTFVWTLPSVLAGSGIHYFAGALNYSRDDISKRPMNMPFYWQGPDGARVLTWLAPHYGWALKLGLTDSLEEAEPKIDDFLRKFDRSDYACDAVFAYGAVEDNRGFPDTLASTVADWNKRYVSPKVILCRGPEFFQYVEKNWKGEIPVISGDLGVCWEDGAASSAVETAVARCATETLLTAEKLNALTTALGNPVGGKAELDAAWKNMVLWDEHTWGASRASDVSQRDHQWNIKSGFAIDLSRQANSALAKGADALWKLIRVSEPSVVVYNPLSWAASGLVEWNAANGRAITFRAENVPPLGYRVYAAKSVPSTIIDGTSFDANTLTLSNRFYTLRVDRATGAIASLRDNELGRELVDASAPHGVNQYVYFAKAGRNDAYEVKRGDDAPPVQISVENRPSGKALIIKTLAYNTPEIISEIVLHDDEKRIDFINTIDKKETTDKESGFFAFPFRLDKPRFHVELPDGVLRPDTQTMPGACMEWYCTQDFVAAEADDCAITWTALDSPLVTLSSANCHYGGHTRRELDKGYIYAYIFTNIWGTNYKPSQGGKMTFRFSLTSARKYDPVSSARFGQSVRNPMIAVLVSPAKGSRQPASRTFSLCSVSPDNVEVQSVKQAESGNGLIIRLRELSGTKTSATLALAPGKFKGAALCNLMEDPEAKLKIIKNKISVPIAANGLATVRVR